MLKKLCIYMFLVNAQKMHSCFYNRIQLPFLFLQLKIKI